MQMYYHLILIIEISQSYFVPLFFPAVRRLSLPLRLAPPRLLETPLQLQLHQRIKNNTIRLSLPKLAKTKF